MITTDSFNDVNVELIKGDKRHYIFLKEVEIECNITREGCCWRDIDGIATATHLSIDDFKIISATWEDGRKLSQRVIEMIDTEKLLEKIKEELIDDYDS